MSGDTLPVIGRTDDALNRQCPHCQTGVGLADAVRIIPERPNSVTVELVCQSCGYRWSVEYQDRFRPPTP